MNLYQFLSNKIKTDISNSEDFEEFILCITNNLKLNENDEIIYQKSLNETTHKFKISLQSAAEAYRDILLTETILKNE